VDTRADWSSHQLIFEPSLGRISIAQVLNCAAKDKSQKISGFVSVLFRQGKRVGLSFIETGNTLRHFFERAMSPYTRFREGQTLSKSPLLNVNCPLFRPSSDPKCGCTHQREETVLDCRNTGQHFWQLQFNDVIYA
jgi:hypothetical protein